MRHGMKKLFLIVALFWPLSLFATTGAVQGMRIVQNSCTAGATCNGWVLEIDYTGMSTEATPNTNYVFALGTNNAPGVNTPSCVVSGPWNSAVPASYTGSRTVYAVQWLRQPYPNQALADETNAGAYTTVRLVLAGTKGGGDIYSGETVACSVPANFYYDGANHSLAATTYSTTNNSTNAYPSPDLRWENVPYELVTSQYYTIETSGFDKFAGANGDMQPLAAVAYSCADTNSHTSTGVVNKMVLSQWGGDLAGKVLVWPFTVDNVGAGFTNDTGKTYATITCNFTGYPWIGNNTQVSSANADPSAKLTPLIYIYGPSYGRPCNIGDATNHSTPTTYATCAAAESAYAGNNNVAYATPAAAITGLKAYNNANNSHNDAGGGIVELIPGTYDWPGAALTSGTNATWVTVQPISTATVSQVIFGSNSGSNTLQANNKIKLSNVTFTGTGTAGTLLTGTGSGDHLWLDEDVFNWNSSNGYLVYRLAYTYLTRNSGSYAGEGFSITAQRIVRGNNLTVANGLGVEAYNVVGNNGILCNIFSPTGLTIADGAVCMFNTVYNTTSQVAWNGGLSTAFNVSIGFSFVQNLIEEESGIAVVFGPCYDSCIYTSNNVLIAFNTLTGAHSNAFYNDGSQSGAYFATSFLHSNALNVGNIEDTWNNKEDTFASQSMGGSKTPTAITKANPGVVTVAAISPWTTGSYFYFMGIGGMTQLNGTTQLIGGFSGNTFTIADTSGMSAFTSGGTITSANPARVGGWAPNYHVGAYGNYFPVTAANDFMGYFTGINSVVGICSNPCSGSGGFHYVNDASASANHGSGLGNGNYYLYSNSGAVALIPAGAGVLPYDLNGYVRCNNGQGSAGPWEQCVIQTPAIGW
jgi:hypothetical protein